jgi:glycerol-3-phosphate dehydrogenase
MVDDGARLDGSCQTHQVKLVGAHGFSKTLFINLIQHFGVETDVAKHLTESYGDRSWTVAALSSPTEKRFPVRGERISPLYPFVDGEVRYAVRHEYAQTAVDVIARRMRLAFLNAQAALEALPKVIDIMGSELKWDNKRKDVEWRDSGYPFPIIFSILFLCCWARANCDGLGVAFLESMGLPKSKLNATRKEVESGKLSFKDSIEYKMYSRHDQPGDELESDIKANPVVKADSPVND